MNYEMFKKSLVKKIEETTGKDVVLRKIDKVDRPSLEAIILNSGNSGNSVCPVVYIEDLFNEYVKTENLEDTVSTAVEMLQQTTESASLPAAEDILSLLEHRVEHRIVFQLIGAAMNEQLLSKVPHRIIADDLAVIYSVIIGDDFHLSVRVNKEMASEYGLSEPELFKLAYENTKRLLKPCVFSMGAALTNFMPKEVNADVEYILRRIKEEEMENGPYMLVLTNKQNICGASSIIFKEVLDSVKNFFEEDVIILPSSRHEVICVPRHATTWQQATEMVRSVNQNELPEADKLSDNVYIYADGKLDIWEMEEQTHGC